MKDLMKPINDIYENYKNTFKEILETLDLNYKFNSFFN